MAALGKRRRGSQDAHSDSDAEARALFQKAFEAKFKPLKTVAKTETTTQAAESDSESNDDNDWSGIESADESVEVIQVQDVARPSDAERSRELKAFMSSKLPTQSRIQTTKATVSKADDEAGETANVENDMALQRLLRESHLLHSSSDKTYRSEVQGTDRLKALDLRMQDLGGKESHLHQHSMPMSHRRGIRTKATEREQKRRKEASDNGIVLERLKATAKTSGPREKGIGGPSVGQYRGGMLKLSSKDVRSIEATRTGGQRRKRGR